METIIQELESGSCAGNEIYIKRDDLLPFSMGGNKVRIAEAFYADMLKKGCDSMIIYGSRHSNLCRVLSNLCRSCGVPCVMICSHDDGEEDAPTANTHLISWTETPIVHCSRGEIAQTVDSVMKDLQNKGQKPYYIYGDKFGKGNEGAPVAAYADAYREIRAYEARVGWEFDYLFCPSGTGATQSGLICGHLLAGDRKKILGVMISSRETERAFEVIDAGVRDYFTRIGRALPQHYQEEIILLDHYRLGGYGKYDKDVEDCIQNQYCQNSIPLDPVYTGKAFLGMTRYLQDNRITGRRILFLHTGGTPLFYDFLMRRQ